MLRPDIEITVNGMKIIYINDIEIESDLNLFTDYVSVSFPKKLSWGGKPLFSGSSSLIKKGDKMTVKLGYNQSFYGSFDFFVSEINVEETVNIKGECLMYNLKRKELSAKVFEEKSLKTIVDFCLQDTGITPIYTVEITNTGTFKIGEGVTVTQVLERLSKDFGVYVFSRNGKVYVGLRYLYEDSKTKSLTKEHIFDYRQNVVSSDMIYKTDEDKKLYFEIVCHLNATGSKKKKYTYGEKGGQKVTLNTNTELSEKEAIDWAKRERPKYVFDGIEGSFEAFGEPFVLSGDRVKLRNWENNELDGVYLVKKVVYKSGTFGFFQTIYPDKKIL